MAEADAAELEQVAAEEPDALRAVAERVECEATREWLLGYLKEAEG
jgi:hypothetical protein